MTINKDFDLCPYLFILRVSEYSTELSKNTNIDMYMS